MIGAAPPKRGLPAFPNGEGANLNQTTPIMGRKVGEDSTCKLAAAAVLWPVIFIFRTHDK